MRDFHWFAFHYSHFKVSIINSNYAGVSYRADWQVLTKVLEGALPPLSTLQMKAVRSFEMLIITYQARLCHNPKDHNMNRLEFLYKQILLGLYISPNAGFSDFEQLAKWWGRKLHVSKQAHSMNRELVERSPKLGPPPSPDLTTSDIFPWGYTNAQVWAPHTSPTMNPWRSVYKDCCSCYPG
jgi:hypothetical protein